MNGLGMYGMRYGARPEDFGAPGTEMPAFMQGQILANQQYAQQQDQQQQMQARQFALQQAEDAADNQQQFNQLASQAYSTAPDQRNTLLGKMAALNPQEAAQQAVLYGEMDKTTQAQHAAALTALAQQFTSIAQMPAGPEQTSAYNALLQRARATGKDVSMFENVPPAVGAKMAVAQIEDIKGLASMNGMSTGDQAKVVGNALVDPRTGKVIYQAPKQEWKFDSTSGTLVNPETGQYRVVTPAGGAGPVSVGQPAPASIIDGNVPAGTQVTQATGPDGTKVAFAFAPGTPDAVKAQTAAGAGVQQSAPMTLAQYKAQTKSKTEGEPTQFGDPTKTGQDYLATLDPQIASQVQALDQGRMQFPSSFALKTPYWQGMLAAVSRYDPSFDAINYNARASARKSFTSGKEAQQVNALNTVAQHLAQLQGYANALDNASFTPYNSIKNALSAKMGNAAPTNFDRTVLPVAQELERVWRGTGGSEADIQQWIKNLSSSSSPAQFKDAFTGLSDLIHGKLAALKDQYVQAMGTTANPYRFLSPATQKLFEGMDSKDAAQFAADATAPNGIPNATPQGAPQTGPIATNPQTGQRVHWNGTAWVPAQ